MKRLILIDGINFFYRGAWNGVEITNRFGEDVSFILSYFKNMYSLLKHFGKQDENKYIICWDGGYDERLRISSEAVKNGLIPKSYKQERREARELEDEEDKQKSLSFMNQLKIAKELTSFTVISQMCKKGEEADDLIGSYSVKYRDQFDEILLVTTDKDYYQLINEKVFVYNSGKDEYKDLKFLKDEYNLDNGDQWVDVGALAGESGKGSDTIYGVPGIGYTTASKLISQYKTLENLIETSKFELAGDILACGSVKELYKKVKNHEYKLKHHKKEMYVLAHKEIVDLAKILKKIRTFLPLEIEETSPSWIELDKYFKNICVPISSYYLELLTDKGNYAI